MRYVMLASWISAATAAGAAMRHGPVPVEAGSSPLTPWLALASVAMVATLVAAHWLVARGRRR